MNNLNRKGFFTTIFTTLFGGLIACKSTKPKEITHNKGTLECSKIVMVNPKTGRKFYLNFDDSDESIVIKHEELESDIKKNGIGCYQQGVYIKIVPPNYSC